jgi:hypothetical protein
MFAADAGVGDSICARFLEQSHQAGSVSSLAPIPIAGVVVSRTMDLSWILLVKDWAYVRRLGVQCWSGVPQRLIEKPRQRTQRRNADERRSREANLIRTGGAIEHPGLISSHRFPFEPSCSQRKKVPSCLSMTACGRKLVASPRMKPVQNLSANAPVGVVELHGTMPDGPTRHGPDAHPMRPMGLWKRRDWRPDDNLNRAYPDRQTV